MNPISSSAPRLAPVPAARAAERPEGLPEESRPAPAKPDRDMYIPEEKRESYGRYWLERDENDVPEIRFEDPEAEPVSTASVDAPEADAPEKGGPAGGGRKAERCTGNTDAVDREIRKLKEKKEALEKRLVSETSEIKAEELKRRLSQVEEELRRKDNDTYRRQHTVFT